MDHEEHPHQHLTDEALLARIALRDEDALGLLYERYVSTLLGIAARFLPERVEAEDVIHDVFLQIWKAAPTYDPSRGTARTWIVMRTRSRLLDRVRKTKRRRELLPEHAAHVTPQDPHPSPDRAYDHARLRHAIHHDLPAHLSQILLLTYFEHMTSTQIAHKLDIPTGTVKSRLALARRQLHDLMTTQPDDEVPS